MADKFIHNQDQHPDVQHRRTHLTNNQEVYQKPYFVTLCTDQNRHFFGSYLHQQIRLSELGCVACRAWYTVTDQYKNITRGKFVIMPNHIHAILWFSESVSEKPLHRGYLQPTVASLPETSTTTVQKELFDHFKSMVTDFLYNEYGFLPFKIWHEEEWCYAMHCEETVALACRYILQNPQRWNMDHLNSNCEGPDPLFTQLRKSLGIRDVVQRKLYRLSPPA